ncbi:hypothetical protein BH23ACT12_BH23ACT12_05540 [soil metagenome]
MTRIQPFRKQLKDETGAEAVEFALVGPIVFFLVLGAVYVLLLFAAQLSLGYATNVGVRYAAVPNDVVAYSYPSAAQVKAKALSATPFFNNSTCTPALTTATANQPVTFTLNCTFPNPAGAAVNGLNQTFFGGGSTVASSVALSATAQSRKE